MIKTLLLIMAISTIFNIIAITEPLQTAYAGKNTQKVLCEENGGRWEDGICDSKTDDEEKVEKMENSHFQTYGNSDLGIKIQYPSSWSFYEDKGEDGTITAVTFVSMSDLTNIRVSNILYTGPENTPLDQIAHILFEEIKQSDPSATLVGQIPLPNIDTPNIENVFFQWTGQQDGTPINHAENLIKHNNDLFEIQYLTLPGKYEQLFTTFSYMLNTLEFIE